MSDTVSALDPAQTFNLIMDNLCKAIAARMAKYPYIQPLLMLVWTRLRRTMARFASLAKRTNAGTAPRPARPGRPRPARPPSAKPRLPTSVGWLCNLVPYQAAGYGSQLSYLLQQPDMIALLEAAPQAKRLLRPLLRMLAAPLPPILAVAARTRTTRTTPPPEPASPDAAGATPADAPPADAPPAKAARTKTPRVGPPLALRYTTRLAWRPP